LQHSSRQTADLLCLLLLLKDLRKRYERSAVRFSYRQGENEAIGIRPRAATANSLNADNVGFGIRQQYHICRKGTVIAVIYPIREQYQCLTAPINPAFNIWTQNYCFIFSHQLNGLTKMITSPGFGDAMALPQVFAVTTPCWRTYG
jgi:hypothetical protein